MWTCQPVCIRDLCTIFGGERRFSCTNHRHVARYRRRMHLEELEWFVVLAEIAPGTEAAAAWTVSQPTLSRALSRFETQVGTPLFDRVNRRLRLNLYGQIMLEHARRSI